MSAGEEDIAIELVDVYHVCVLVGVELVGEGKCLLVVGVSELDDVAVGVPAEEGVVE